jgi:UDP-N-acetylmuramoyl-L-alanyl-D-glutamate--2,6-diaminopimelate ligase
LEADVTSTSVVEIASLIGAQLVGDSNIGVTGVSLDSHTIEVGELFAALPGRSVHGARFVEQAIQRGASAILTDPVGMQLIDETEGSHNIPILEVSDPRARLGEVCKLVYGDPTAEITVIGVTGTNGKSTTTSMIYQAVRAVGISAGLVGTLATLINGDEIVSNRTTPEAPDLFRTLARMKTAGVKIVAMEVSSIALSEHRVNGLEFDCVAFTNLSHDHLDYHGSMSEYFAAKAQLFTPKFARFAMICTDSPWGVELCEKVTIPYESVGTVGAPNWKINRCIDTSLASSWTVSGPSDEIKFDSLAMPGEINALNAALALSVLDHVGIRGNNVVEAICTATVPGRGELVGTRGDVSIFVDYAHSPESVEQFLTGLKNEFSGRIITVLGAGGDRDTSKRASMGRVGASLSDILIVTDDNPRSEDPSEIRKQIIEGVSGFPASQLVEIGDRLEAIARALELASGHDVVAILGKGHERGQEIMGQTIAFSDVDVVGELLVDEGLHD